MENLFNWLSELVSNFGNTVIQVLPHSPFRDFIDNLVLPDYVGFFNWFFPVKQLMTVLTIWLAAIGIFYFYSIIMRWIKLIGD